MKFSFSPVFFENVKTKNNTPNQICDLSMSEYRGKQTFTFWLTNRNISNKKPYKLISKFKRERQQPYKDQ